MHAVVSVTVHQDLDIATLRLLEVVLDGKRTKLISVERKAPEGLELATFDIQTNEMNESRRLGGLEDFTEGDCGQFDRPRLLSRFLPAAQGVLDAAERARLAEDHPFAALTGYDLLEHLAGAALHV